MTSIEKLASFNLLPCPFCGSSDWAHIVGKFPAKETIECDNCGARGPLYGYSVAVGAAVAWNTRAAPKPRPWLRAEDVTESGSYWWVNDASYATPVTVYVMKSGTDESCFASAGQLGWWKAMQLKDLGGLWQRIPEPELPKEKP